MTTDPQIETDALADRFEAIRRAMAVVAADRPTPEQITEWNTADREMAQRIRAALPGVPLHHAYAVLQALRVTQRLDAAAAEPLAVVPPAPADRSELRDRIADTVTPFLANFSDEETAKVNAREVADAVLADLTAPNARAAVLAEALARVEDPAERAKTTTGLGLGWESARDVLRLMADEEQQPETQAAPCGRLASIPSPCSAGDHCCGGPFTAEELAVAQADVDALNAEFPDDDAPAAVAQPGKEA